MPKTKTKSKATEVSNNRIKEAVALYEELGSYQKTAEALAKKWSRPVLAANIKAWVGGGDVPMSEDEKKNQKATAEKCIAELRKIAQEHPTQVISRNFFRVNSHLAESAWSKHFGTFREFKRQANITLSRHQHKMELDVAKHASLDNFRAMTLEKRDWSENYLRPNNKRFQTMMVCNDVHDIESDPFWVACFLDTLKRVMPDVLILNGDIFDLPEFGKYNVDPREWDVVGRISWVHNFLKDIREIAPDMQIDFIEGNHEYRMLRHLAEQSPAMQAVLADLHGWTIPKLLGLEEYEVNYIAPADLATLSKSEMNKAMGRNFKVYNDMFIACHFPSAKSMGLPGVSGHHHGREMWQSYNPLVGRYEWHQIGCGHKLEATYTNGEKWGLGFGIVSLDTERKHCNTDSILITDHAWIGGKLYVRP